MNLSLLQTMTFFGKQEEPDPAWRIFQTREEARDAARIATGGQVADQAWYRACEDVRHAQGDRGWNESNRAVSEAVEYLQLNPQSIKDAERDIRLLVHCMNADIRILQEQYHHAVARWNVWVAQYGLACDVDGILYVYRDRPPARFS
jgi:hypothetical protein